MNWSKYISYCNWMADMAWVTGSLSGWGAEPFSLFKSPLPLPMTLTLATCQLFPLFEQQCRWDKYMGSVVDTVACCPDPPTPGLRHLYSHSCC